jgi:multidrug efflux pump subunit AcrA (membrane-fusion protein)
MASFFFKQHQRSAFSGVLLLSMSGILALGAVSCDKSTSKNAPPKDSSSANQQSAVKAGASTTLTMTREESKRFETIVIRETNFVENLRVSAQAVAGAIPSLESHLALVVFEVPEMTQVFSSYIKSKAAFERALKQYDRVKEMIAGNAASGRELLEAQTDRNQAEAEHREAESRLIQNSFSPQQLERMRAGTVLMMCDVPEARLVEVDIGERVEFDFTSFPNEVFYGRVMAISNAIDPQTRTVKVSIELPNPKGRIKLGMFARVTIERSTVRALALPHEAIVSADAKSFVFVRTTDSTFERRQVMLGADNGKEFELKSGLQAGENVVVTNAILLKGLSFGY